VPLLRLSRAGYRHTVAPVASFRADFGGDAVSQANPVLYAIATVLCEPATRLCHVYGRARTGRVTALVAERSLNS